MNKQPDQKEVQNKINTGSTDHDLEKILRKFDKKFNDGDIFTIESTSYLKDFISSEFKAYRAKWELEKANNE